MPTTGFCHKYTKPYPIMPREGLLDVAESICDKALVGMVYNYCIADGSL